MLREVIIKLDGAEVWGLHEILTLEDASVPGQQVRLKVIRSGRELDLDLKVEQRRRLWN
jgi:S1-C subfamily serine protease